MNIYAKNLNINFFETNRLEITNHILEDYVMQKNCLLSYIKINTFHFTSINFVLNSKQESRVNKRISFCYVTRLI